MAERTTIYVAGFPKSGNTWLTRLLADALNCPAGGCVPQEDKQEIASEGWDRPGAYVVRKGHFILVDEDTPEAVPRPHFLNWKRLTTERVVFLLRDPRDIAVSVARHWRIPVHEALRRMMVGGVARIMPPWDEYVSTWLDTPIPCAVARYERLLDSGVVELKAILERLKVDPLLNCAEAVERQSFEARRADIAAHGDGLNKGKEYNLWFMRKGVAGDWKEHFTREMGRKAQERFGPLLARLGYERNPKWWEELPK